MEPTVTSPRIGKDDPKEQILHKELNDLADRGHRHFQWSVTLLLSLETALFFIRKEAAERGGLAPGEPFPILRHLVGTAVVVGTASILFCISRAIFSLYEQYYAQLPIIENSGIHRPTIKNIKWITFLPLILFPIFDLAIGFSNYINPLRHDPSFAPTQGSIIYSGRQWENNGNPERKNSDHPSASPPLLAPRR